MSIPRIGGNGSEPLPATLRGYAPAAGRTAATVTTPGGLTPTQTPAATPGSVPTAPPAGTDPALWSVLSGEERAFFAKAGAMGPLTYGRAFSDMKAAQLPANRGGRLDVKI